MDESVVDQISIVVAYRGRWVPGDLYTDFAFQSILVPSNVSMDELEKLVVEQCHLHMFGFVPDVSSIHFVIGSDFGKNIKKFIELKSDRDLIWFVNIVRNAIGVKTFPLVVDVVDGLVPSSSFVKGKFHSGASSSSSACSDVEEDIQSSMDYVVIDDVDIDRLPNSFDVKKGNHFLNKSTLKKVMHSIAIRKNFEFMVERSNGEYYVLRCKEYGCSWMMRASKISGSDLWVVRKYVPEHTCTMVVSHNEHRQATSHIVSEFIIGDFSRGLADVARPKDVISLMRGKHGLRISYYKARIARNFALQALRGTTAESYACIPALCDVLKQKNPGSFTAYELTSEGKFLYFFMCLGASIQGWRHCRPVISVDGTFLKNQFCGTLLLSAMLDGNNHIFPLGFAIVDSENDLSWEWFFRKLKEAIGDHEELVVVSDRKSSIPKAVAIVFPNASHGFCMQHLLRNLNAKYPSANIDGLFYRCAKAYRIEEFECYMRQMDGIRPGIRKYLLDVGFEKWARSHFVRKRYDIMTTNISESMNAILLDAREYPIVALVEFFRSLLQRWFFERRNEARGTFTYLTPWAYRRLSDRELKARLMVVNPIDIDKYHIVDGGVNEVVDLLARTCSCRVWQCDDFPCGHAIAALWKKNIKASDVVSHYYTNAAYLATYEACIFPTGDKSHWEVPENIWNVQVFPPDVKPAAGRPKKHRISSVGEKKKSVKCGRCQQYGHNKRTCERMPFVMGSSSQLGGCQQPHN